MAKKTPLINNFTAGELSPKVDVRSDVQKYFTGCRTMENFYPLIEGAAKRMPGTKFLASMPGGQIEITSHQCFDGDYIGCTWPDDCGYPAPGNPAYTGYDPPTGVIPPPIGCPIVFWGTIKNTGATTLHDVWVEDDYAGYPTGSLDPGTPCADHTIVAGIVWADTLEIGSTKRTLAPGAEIEYSGWYAPSPGSFFLDTATVHAVDTGGNSLSDTAQPTFPGCIFFTES